MTANPRFGRVATGIAQKLLDAFAQATPGVASAVLLSADGFEVASLQAGKGSAARLAAMGSSLSARAIGADRLPDALALLSRDARENLLLLDLAARLGDPPPPGEMATELVGAFRGAELVGVGALRPTIAFDAAIEGEALAALLPLVETLDVGLVKSEPRCVEQLWSHLARRRRHLGPAAARRELRVAPEFPHVVHPGVGDVRCFEPFDHLIRCQARENARDLGMHRIAVVLAGGS